MAEGFVNQDSFVCRYFLSGTCRDAEVCLFSHDSSTGRIPDTVCRYYLQGICTFGEKCRYDHILLNNKNIPKSYSNNEWLSAGPSAYSGICDTRNSSTVADMNKTSTRSQNFTNLSRYFSKKDGSESIKPGSASTNWVNAPEFVPKHFRSYADIAKTNVRCNELDQGPSEEICPLFSEGTCPFPDCQLIHGNVCELCRKACLHPYNEQQRKSHIEKCEKELEQEMEFSFAVQRSSDKTCGICMDVVLEKEPVSERRFGILEKCNHVYCLSCIRKWRASREHEKENDQYRACPECRIPSNFIIPNLYYIDDEEEKQKLIAEYKTALGKKPCKYFKQGNGICMFGGSCFYLHATPDGTKVELPPPLPRRRQNQDGEFENLRQNLLWDYLENREENNAPINLFADLMLADSDDDDDDEEAYIFYL